jgi:voltage-gated potassium channel
MAAVRWVRLASAIVLVIVAYALVPTQNPFHTGSLARLAMVLLLLLGSAWVMIRQLRLTAMDGDRNIEGLVLAVVIMTVIFALSFYLLELRHPGQVDGLDTKVDALYFTASTMLTIGYGDVHAEGQAARVLVLVQMVFDVVFVATAATMLTSRLRRAASARVAARGGTGMGSAGSPPGREPERGGPA